MISLSNHATTRTHSAAVFIEVRSQRAESWSHFVRASPSISFYLFLSHPPPQMAGYKPQKQSTPCEDAFPGLVDAWKKSRTVNEDFSAQGAYFLLLMRFTEFL